MDHHTVSFISNTTDILVYSCTKVWNNKLKSYDDLRDRQLTSVADAAHQIVNWPHWLAGYI